MSQRRGGPFHSRQINTAEFAAFAMLPSSCILGTDWYIDGLVHRHGPRNNPCPGSQQPPLDASVQAASQASHSQPDSVTAAIFEPKQTGYVASGHFSFSWSTAGLLSISRSGQEQSVPAISVVCLIR